LRYKITKKSQFPILNYHLFRIFATKLRNDMRFRLFFLFLVALQLPSAAFAQSVSPTATYLDDNNNSVDSSTDFSGQAPLDVTFRANPSDMDDHTPAYEWHFRKEGEERQQPKGF